MNALIDDCYLELFKYVNLNDLMSCRLVSKRFRNLVDSMRIKKLAIFKGLPPRPGKFQLLNEQYDLSDCVHVLSLDSFFASKTILKCLEKLEKLAIFTWDHGEKNFFKVQFNELTYLEIDCVTIIHPTILASPKLERIFYYQAWMNEQHEDSSGLPILVNDFGFDKLISKRLKHINFRNLVDQPFLEYCVRRGLLNEIEVIEVQLFDLESLFYIVENCPKLKKIDAYLGFGAPLQIESVKQMFSDRITDQQLRTAANKLKRMNPDLAVYLWSLPFNSSTCKRVRQFFSQLNNAIEVRHVNLLLRISTDRVYQLLRHFDRDHFLDEFWRKVNVAIVKNVMDEARYYERLTNCVVFNTSLDNRSDLAIAKEAIRSMPLQLRDFGFQSNSMVQCGNDVLDLLPKHVKYVSGLTLECWGPISFDFLFGMVGLKFVRLFLVYPMPQSVYLDLIRTRKHLAYFEVYCEREEDQEKEQLSSFKKQVNECLDKELGYKDAVFRIDVLSDRGQKLVRYVMKRKKLSFGKMNDLGLGLKMEVLCPIDAEEKFFKRVFASVAHSKSLAVGVDQI